MNKKIFFWLLFLSSCMGDNTKKKNGSDLKNLNEDSIKTHKMITKLIDLDNSRNNIIYGVWAIDSVEEKNRIQKRYVNSDSSFTSYDFRNNNKVYFAKNSGDLGIKIKLFGDFKVYGDTVYIFSKVDNIILGFKFEIKNKGSLILINGDPIGYKNIRKIRSYLTKIPDYKSDYYVKKIMRVERKKNEE